MRLAVVCSIPEWHRHDRFRERGNLLPCSKKATVREFEIDLHTPGNCRINPYDRLFSGLSDDNLTRQTVKETVGRSSSGRLEFQHRPQKI